jgi:hypothetical protein
METPFQTATRMLTALEELVMEETTLIRGMDFIEAVDVRERSGPLVEKLCALAAYPEVAVMRPRVAALLELWGQNHHFLDMQLTRLQGELNRVTEARGRLRHVVPAYLGQTTASESRLNTAA